ncbi:acyl-CoA dehydrogenase family protein [Synechococcus elongatus]|uniref:Dibenzothiophene monooxygenase n=1 Tax=Synechococcus elongatus PCC 11802 TaxID=2283154 RepID=A0AAU6R4Y4_SYNEL|nr:acyl-CoA dehydrogenase family protein [Synechococcus elongatus]QFZ92425.1 monooxygenase [Synechococcus elongatus PCC 11802]
MGQSLKLSQTSVLSPELQVQSKDYLQIAKDLAQEFAKTAIERDKQGGTPQAERDRIRSSGLLSLVIPKQYGGAGENWITAFQISREFAKVDSSLAHVYSYHHLGVTIPHIFGSESQKEHFYTKTIQNQWWWCNALNPLDRRLVLTPHQDYFILNGTKSFCSGSHDSDILPITAVNSETQAIIILAIPSNRLGIKINHDWDNIGQRQTDSGSIHFENVTVYPEEIFGDRTQTDIPFRTIRACLTQLNLAHIYLGITEGALTAAKHYTLTETRPWLTSTVNQTAEDPYILQHYGEMWVELQAVIHLTESAAILLQSAWDKEITLSEEERGQCAIVIAAAKVTAAKTGLRITNRIFEVMGARSTNSRYGFDRYWRNLRTFTLHDSIDYKVQEIGKWALNNQLPQPSFYS